MWFLIRLLLLLLLLLLIKRIWCSLVGAVRDDGGLPPRNEVSSQSLVYDPECGLHFPLADALTVRTDQGVCHFCSRECRDAYLGKVKKIQA
jgi:hypothetical protein